MNWILLGCTNGMYPQWITLGFLMISWDVPSGNAYHFAIEAMAIDIVFFFFFPSNSIMIFYRYVNVYPRVTMKLWGDVSGDN